MTESADSGADGIATGAGAQAMDATASIGIDMGGTKTRVQAWSEHGPIADLTVPSRGVLHADYARTGEALALLVRRLLGEGRLPAAVAVGAHGCDSAAQCAALREQVVRHLPVLCTVVNDAELLLPAAGLTSGVAVVSGTGSVAIGHTTGGEVLQAGGWGWLLGDEGSAAGLVRHAARTCLARADEGHVENVLSRRMQAAFKVDSVADLAQVMERNGGASSWGRHAAEVFAAADAGCPSAMTVIDDAGKALAALVRTLRNRGAETDVVVVAGGVFVSQPRLRDAFEKSLRLDLPDSRVVVLTEAPVIGAVNIATAMLRGQAARLRLGVPSG